MSDDPHDVDTFVDQATESGLELEPELGQLFAHRYRIERTIGRGSMGMVYAAHDRVVDEMVALKLLVTPSERALDRFRREVRLARRVTHRNAARTYDLGEFGGAHFITMELVEGESLQLRLDRQSQLPVDEVIRIAYQVCLGLHAAHGAQVVHRDLKPANVLIEKGGRAVITDFGVAWSASEHDATGENVPMAGTPAYMAPEQVMGLALDTRADLYALGVMLFTMLTGQTPFSGGNRIEVAMARMHREAPDPRSLAKVPDELAKLVLRCLERDPEQRPSSPAILAKELAALDDATVFDLEHAIDTASSIGNSSFAPTSPGESALAVMPFRYRGPTEDAYLAEALTDELIDLLAMTRGLRVSASGATALFKADRDARTVGRTLGVDAIVDGTIQRRPPMVRIVARLVDVHTGFQRWSERFEGRLEDVFALEDRMAKRIAEALRVELTLLRVGAVVSAQAVELYLRGRVLVRENEGSGQALAEGLDYFDQAHTLAPGFALALAARADARVRHWFISRGEDSERRALAARAAVSEALAGAPDVAETHLAAARLAVNEGAFANAAQELNKALVIAPTYAAAHEYLGLLQCDAGRSREGVQHIVLAHELDPSLNLGVFPLLRHHAMNSDAGTYEAFLAKLRKNPQIPPFGLDLFEMRFALWAGDRERAEQLQPAEQVYRGTPILDVFSATSTALDSEVSDEEVGARLERAADRAGSPRLRTAWRQLAVEVLAWRGALEAAIDMLVLADSEAVLLDADWLESCPLLEPIRARPEVALIRRRVRERADEIWRMGSQGGG